MLGEPGVCEESSFSVSVANCERVNSSRSKVQLCREQRAEQKEECRVLSSCGCREAAVEINTVCLWSPLVGAACEVGVFGAFNDTPESESGVVDRIFGAYGQRFTGCA